MGKFDGILICSDWDGTLFTGGEVPEKSVKAIRYFQENGGLFTVCSGRDLGFLKRYEHFVKPNTYALCLNGAKICDTDTGEVIREGFVGPEAYDMVDSILASGAKILTVNFVEKGANDIVQLSVPEYKRLRPELINKQVYKLTVSATDPQDGELMSAAAREFGAKEHSAVRSFAPYIEILKNENTKGVAARFLKEYVGAKLLVGMGDYENDIFLLEAVDISYAVGNAIDALKKVASKVTVSVSEGAVAEVIKDLELHFCK